MLPFYAGSEDYCLDFLLVEAARQALYLELQLAFFFLPPFLGDFLAGDFLGELFLGEPWGKYSA